MEINIKVMTEEAYATLQKNSDEVYQMICDHPSDSSWLANYLGFEPYETKKYTIVDFELKYDEKYENVAFDNAITIYEHLNELPRYILCDTKFWAWINFEKAYKQAIKSSELTKSSLKNLWLPSTNRRHLMLGVLSRYYFMTDISVDLTSKELYKNLKYLLKNGELYRLLSYANIGMLRNMTLAIIKAMNEYSVKNEVLINKKDTREIFKWASKLSSVRLVDLMDQEEIYDYIYKKIEKVMGESEFTVEFDF